jgi:hypothetical protein
MQSKTLSSDAKRRLRLASRSAVVETTRRRLKANFLNACWVARTNRYGTRLIKRLKYEGKGGVVKRPLALGEYLAASGPVHVIDVAHSLPSRGRPASW